MLHDGVPIGELVATKHYNEWLVQVFTDVE